MAVRGNISGIDSPQALENALRVAAGQSGYGDSFIGYWLDKLIFYDFPPRVFTIVYLSFGTIVLLTMWLAPIRIANPSRESSTDR